MKTIIHICLYCSQFLEREMLQAKVVEKIKTRILCLIIFFENHTIYEITWKNVLEPERPQMTKWHLCIVC